MALGIEIDGTAAAGEVVQGAVTGLDEHQGARAVVVALVHEPKHLPRGPRVETVLDLADRRAASLPFSLALPADAAPTFQGRRYASVWRVEARLDLPHRRDVAVAAPLVVTPAAGERLAEGAPVTAARRGPRAFRIFAGAFLVADFLALAGLYVAFGSVPTPVALAFVAPAALTLAALAWLGLRPGAVDRLEVALPRARWRFGEELPVRVVVEGDPERVAAIEVALRGEEVWIEGSGKSAHERRASFHEEVRRIAEADLGSVRAGGRRWDQELRFRLPDGGLPTQGDRIQWSVQARVRVPRRVDPVAILRLEVAGGAPRSD